ncbi:MAG: peptidylprolyl isomerase [Chlorobi bacterium]|nr:peptidylprolyl isomerase [Chlorobiota bacterium]
MKTEKNKVVSVTYELRTDKNGEIIDSANENNPLNFIFGNGMMLPEFEKNLENLSENDTFDFMLTPENGYGLRNEENIAELPLNIFEQNGKIDENLLKPGNIIPLQDNRGNRFNGKVISVTDNTVKLDFNHPLAGENLYFTGKIISVRDASKEELEHGHVH